MRTQEQIAMAAMKKNIAFKVVYFNEGYLFPHMEVCMSGAWDGYCTSAWFSTYDDGRVYCADGYPTKAMRNFAERLFHQCSDLHECDWTF